MEVNGQLYPVATLSPEKECPVSTDLIIQWTPKPVCTSNGRLIKKKALALLGIKLGSSQPVMSHGRL
jgi:hypothetical protein